jgi:hypothetical protein
MQSEPEQPTVKDTRRAKWFTFLAFLGFSALEISLLEISLLVDDKLTFVKWTDWLIAGAAIFFPILTVIAGINLVKDWSNWETDRVVERTFGWLIGAPIIILLGVWVLVSVVGWLNSIPSWAAVIIALLVLLLLRR